MAILENGVQSSSKDPRGSSETAGIEGGARKTEVYFTPLGVAERELSDFRARLKACRAEPQNDNDFDTVDGEAAATLNVTISGADGLCTSPFTQEPAKAYVSLSIVPSEACADKAPSKRTTIHPPSSCPSWKESFSFSKVGATARCLRVVVKGEEDLVADSFLGQGSVVLSELMDQEEHRIVVQLYNAEENRNERKGVLELSAQFFFSEEKRILKKIEVLEKECRRYQQQNADWSKNAKLVMSNGRHPAAAGANAPISRLYIPGNKFDASKHHPGAVQPSPFGRGTLVETPLGLGIVRSFRETDKVYLIKFSRRGIQTQNSEEEPVSFRVNDAAGIPASAYPLAFCHYSQVKRAQTEPTNSDKLTMGDPVETPLGDGEIVALRIHAVKLATDNVLGDTVSEDNVSRDEVSGDKASEDKVAEDKVTEDEVLEGKVAEDRVAKKGAESESFGDCNESLVYVVKVTKLGATGYFDSSVVTRKKKKAYEMTALEKLTEAKALKNEGNAFFKEGKNAEAIVRYMRALAYLNYFKNGTDEERAEMLQVMITCNLNLAAAKLKVSQFREAKIYADNAVKQLEAVKESQDAPIVERLGLMNVSAGKLFKEWPTKALYRRAQASYGLGELSEARLDLVEALKLSPSDRGCRVLLNKVSKQLSAARKKEKKTWSKVFQQKQPELEAAPGQTQTQSARAAISRDTGRTELQGPAESSSIGQTLSSSLSFVGSSQGASSVGSNLVAAGNSNVTGSTSNSHASLEEYLAGLRSSSELSKSHNSAAVDVDELLRKLDSDRELGKISQTASEQDKKATGSAQSENEVEEDDSLLSFKSIGLLGMATVAAGVVAASAIIAFRRG